MPAAGSGDGIVSQFLALKRESDADVLAMQCGDFYEFFGDDAELVSEELDLTISQKGAGDRTYSMAGVPLADLTPYLKALVERGYRVAVADQRETDSGFRREVTRVATPGTLLETTEADAQYLAGPFSRTIAARYRASASVVSNRVPGVATRVTSRRNPPSVSR